jgi:two-component system OmpR family response regulator
LIERGLMIGVISMTSTNRRYDFAMTESPHILIVDDHRDIREPLARYLAKQGYRQSQAKDAAEARSVLKTHAIDLIVLDVMMPGEDGLSLCRSLRAVSEIPIILLTAMAEDTDRIVGLEMGADDYITKPFNPRELLARIKSVLRRTHAMPPGREKLDEDWIGFDVWKLDVRRQELIGEDGVTVPLSTAEFQLLTAFINHPRMVLSRDQLLDLTRGRDAGPFDRSIDNAVSRLRRKIEPDPKTPTLIKTHWGGGYSFTPEISRP